MKRDKHIASSRGESSRAGYSFGDSDLAARRLDLLAKVFRESTREFLAIAAANRPEVAIDLGCGPGHTTHLIGEALGCRSVVGIDASSHFHEIARKTANSRVRFELADVSVVALPGAPADLIFCRFLLTHLRDPVDTASKWASQLRPSGLLMMEETEHIETRNSTFARYLEIVAAMLAAQSHTLYAGRMLAMLGDRIGLGIVRNHSYRLKVSNADAAGMFAMNMDAISSNEFVRARFSAAEMAELRTSLEDLARDRTSRSGIEWALRQTALLANR